MKKSIPCAKFRGKARSALRKTQNVTSCENNLNPLDVFVQYVHSSCVFLNVQTYCRVLLEARALRRGSGAASGAYFMSVFSLRSAPGVATDFDEIVFTPAVLFFSSVYFDPLSRLCRRVT